MKYGVRDLIVYEWIKIRKANSLLYKIDEILSDAMTKGSNKKDKRIKCKRSIRLLINLIIFI